MKDIGKYLKQARIDNGVSLDEASEDLNMSVVQLENIEEGNVRAFKDIFSLRGYVKDYAKYLGLDVNKLSDEFNDFMFEKTSKISLADIMYATENTSNEEKDRVVSPYTRIRVKKEIPLKPLLWVLVGILIVLLVILGFIQFSNKKEPITSELLGRGSDIHEYTY